jgi:hypothetical protein
VFWVLFLLQLLFWVVFDAVLMCVLMLFRVLFIVFLGVLMMKLKFTVIRLFRSLRTGHA